MAESNKERQPITDSQRRKNELIAEMARARSGMTLHVGQVAYQSNVTRRVKNSFGHHIGVWLAGALVTGGFLSMLPAREKKVYVNPLSKDGKGKLAATTKPSGGFLLSLIKALVPIMKPILTAFITKQLANVVGGAEAAQKSAEHTTQAAEHTTQAAERTTEAAAAT